MKLSGSDSEAAMSGHSALGIIGRLDEIVHKCYHATPLAHLPCVADYGEGQMRSVVNFRSLFSAAMNRIVFLVAGLFFILPQSGQAQLHPIGINDLFDLRQVGSPRVSPDGRWIAFTVQETLMKDDKQETGLWMISRDGKDALRMTAAGYSASRPRWSPDGKVLSFLASKGEEKTQVWALDRRGGDAHAITKVKQGVGSYEWSPDGTQLLLSIRDPKPDADDKKPRPWVIDRLQFKRDYAGYLDDRHIHLFVMTVGDTTLTQITSGRYDEGQAVWSPDGKRVAFVSNRTDEPDGNDNADIWIVRADNTDKGGTLLQVTKNEGSDDSPTWSPEGNTLAYVTNTRPELIWYATNNLATIPATGGQPHILTPTLDRNVSRPRFSSDGKGLYFILEESAERHLARIDTDGKRMTRPVDGRLSVRSYTLAPDDTPVTLLSKQRLPGELFEVDEHHLKQLTTVNDSLMAGFSLAEVRNIHFNSKDGTEIEGFIFLPPGYDPALKYPTLLRIHGGPTAQYDYGFNSEAQLFAANGYAVVIANPRGSSGYGEAFSKAIWADWGHLDFEDVMAGVDYAVAQGYSDPERLGVGGWSYGGILTNYVITQTDRFKGAISGASEVLYRSNYGHDHYQHDWEMELGLPWENAEAWERISPFNNVANITTPTLIMGGEKDWNVPILNSEQLYQALRRLGRTTQLVVYPGEHHGFGKPSFRKDRLERYLAWYGRYVKGSGAGG